MKRKEFIERLEKNLIGLSQSDKDEIINEFNQHFNFALEKGRSEEEICNSLGIPEEIASSYDSSTINSTEERLNYDKEIIANEEFEIDDISTLTYEMNIGEVKIIPSETDKISAVLKAKDPSSIKTASIKKKDSVLNINISIKSFLLNMSINKILLIIKVPDNKDFNIIGKLGVGSTKISDITVGVISNTIKAGDMKVTNVISKNIVLDLKTGSLTLKNIKSDILATTHVGDVKAECISGFNIIKITSNTGSVKATNVHSDITMIANIGDIVLTSENFKYNADLKSTTGDIKLIFDNNSFAKINASTRIGNIKIKKNHQIIKQIKKIMGESVEAVIGDKPDNIINADSDIGSIIIK